MQSSERQQLGAQPADWDEPLPCALYLSNALSGTCTQ